MPPDMLAMLLMMNGGVPSTGDVNASQDLLFNYLMSPEFGALTGTYDPYLTVDQGGGVAPPEIGMPITMGYASGTGTMAEIAQKLWSGEWTYATALQQLTNKQMEPESDVYNLDLTPELSKMRDEINDYTQRAAQGGGTNQDNVYAKAGLPTPDRQWTVADAPMSERVQSRMADISAMERSIAAAEKRLGDPTTVTIEAAGRRGSPSIAAERSSTATKDGREKVAGGTLPDEGAEGYGIVDSLKSPINYLRNVFGADEEKPEEKQMWDMINPEWLAKKRRIDEQKRILGYNQQVADAQRLGGVVGRRMAGSTPFGDAMQQRLQTLAMLRQFSGM